MSDYSPHILDATAETFERDVPEQSFERPVVIDFWAEWCQPCRILGPVLERLANEYGGAFLLVKANTEILADVAARFGVRSIPAVFAVRDGEVVDGFVGVLSERDIRAFLDRLLPTPAETKIIEARRLEHTDPQRAEALYREAVALADDDPRAKIGLARVLLGGGQVVEAQTLIADLERRGFLEPDAERIKAELTLRGQAEGLGNVEQARANLAANPDDLGLVLQLAEALAAVGQYPEALQLCLDLVERDRAGVGEEARKTMLAVFQLLPADSPLLANYRRQLSFVL
jgi:putative thioredoxin